MENGAQGVSLLLPRKPAHENRSLVRLYSKVRRNGISNIPMNRESSSAHECAVVINQLFKSFSEKN